MLRAWIPVSATAALIALRTGKPRAVGGARARPLQLAGLLALGFAATPGPASAADAMSRAEGRGQPFWLALAGDCAIQSGESTAQLVNEAVTLLGSRDPQWRDDVGYGVVAACVYQARRLSPAERRSLIQTLSVNLRRGLGEIGTDSVLLRSFSALDLSVFAALELTDPALDERGYRQLLDDALAYLHEERDLRGLEPGVGWIHATAHTADLLKFLARDPRFTVADQRRLWEAAWAKMTARDVPVWSHAEEERMAAALLSVVRRTDFEVAYLEPWLARFVTLERQVWTRSLPDSAGLDALQNARHMLQSLFVLLSMPEPEPTAGQTLARKKVLDTLQSLRH